MKVQDNFDIREFVPEEIWKLHKAGRVDARWYIDKKVPSICLATKVSDFESRSVIISLDEFYDKSIVLRLQPPHLLKPI